MVKSIVLAASGAAIALACATPSAADWQVSPFTTDIGDAELSVGGAADGSAYLASQPDFAGLDRASVTGAASVSAKLTRTYDTGLVLSLKSVFEVYHDKLSSDNYGGDLVQK